VPVKVGIRKPKKLFEQVTQIGIDQQAPREVKGAKDENDSNPTVRKTPSVFGQQ